MKAWSTSRVVANILLCEIVVREFELQLRYNVYFRINTLRKVTE